MRQICEYLSTKVKLSKFPPFPLKDEFIEFLKHNGFIEVKPDIYDFNKFLIYKAKYSTSPIYVLNTIIDSSEVYGIRFCNYGEINENNPLLFCYLSNGYNENELKKYIYNIMGNKFIGYNITNEEEIQTWEEFEHTFKQYIQTI